MLRLRHVPSGAVVEVRCREKNRATGCPFFVRVLVPRRGVVDVVRALHLRHKLLFAGTILDLMVARANERAAVLRLVVRFPPHKPRAIELCRDPGQVSPDPVRC